MKKSIYMGNQLNITVEVDFNSPSILRFTLWHDMNAYPDQKLEMCCFDYRGLKQLAKTLNCLAEMAELNI